MIKYTYALICCPSSGPAWAAPGALLAGRGLVVVLLPAVRLAASCGRCVPSWCRWASRLLCRSCGAVWRSLLLWWSAVLLSMLGGCWGLLLIVGALAVACSLPWSSGAGAACVLPLLPWIAPGVGSCPAVGSCPRSGLSPNCIARFQVAWRGIWRKFAPGGKPSDHRNQEKRPTKKSTK